MSSAGAGWKRLLWEILIVGLVAGLGWLAWTWQAGQHREALGAQEEALRAEFLEQRRALEARAAAALGDEAEAVARTFAAAIRTPAAAGDWAAVDRAAVELLFLPKLAFVHLLGPAGEVLVSSDRKLLATGTVGEAGAWALGAAELLRRSEPAGLVEVATPIEDDGELVAVLWLGYRPAETAAAEE